MNAQESQRRWKLWLEAQRSAAETARYPVTNHPTRFFGMMARYKLRWLDLLAIRFFSPVSCLCLVALLFSPPSTAQVWEEETTSLSIVAGDESYTGGELQYEDFAVRVGQLDERVCVRTCGNRCREWATRDASMYEGLLYVPLPWSDWHVYGALGFLNGKSKNSATVGAGVRYRYKHLVATIGLQSEATVVGGVGFAASW